MKWHFSTSKEYQGTPHEWVNGWYEHRKFYRRMIKLIRDHGVTESFHMPGKKSNSVRYYYRGGYRYWVMWPVVNRTRVGWKYPVSMTGPNPWMYRPKQWQFWHRPKNLK